MAYKKLQLKFYSILEAFGKNLQLNFIFSFPAKGGELSFLRIAFCCPSVPDTIPLFCIKDLRRCILELNKCS